MYIEVVFDHRYEKCVQSVEEKKDLAKVQARIKMFKSSDHGRCDMDVRFLQSCRAKVNVLEGEVYFSGKRTLYGYMVEAPVLLSELKAGRNAYYSGSATDL